MAFPRAASAWATQAAAPSMALVAMSLDTVGPPVLHVEELALALLVYAELLPLRVEELEYRRRRLPRIRLDAEGGAEELPGLLVQEFLYVGRSRDVEGMAQDHVDARGHEVAADRDGLLAHPLGGD